VISLVAALLVYFSLHARLVRPMARVTQSMVDFRHDPSNPWSVIRPGTRADEIGIAERELATMQVDLRAALRQNRRLAELGQAVSKISHDLRNILATATLVSDRIASIDDPEVQRLAPTLLRSVDRAATLASETLRYGRAEEPVPHRSDFDLHELLDDVGTSAGVGQGACVAWRNEVPERFSVNADRDQVFRALLNLTRNAVEAMDADADARRGPGGQVEARAARVNGHVAIDIIDTGPGLPPKAREALFRPFAGSARAGGTGLGLAIARDIARAHRGDIHLVRSDDRGTQFRLEIPDA
jgi:signal transduction histidine kinase